LFFKLINPFSKVPPDSKCASRYKSVCYPTAPHLTHLCVSFCGLPNQYCHLCLQTELITGTFEEILFTSIVRKCRECNSSIILLLPNILPFLDTVNLFSIVSICLQFMLLILIVNKTSQICFDVTSPTSDNAQAPPVPNHNAPAPALSSRPSW